MSNAENEGSNSARLALAASLHSAIRNNHLEFFEDIDDTVHEIGFDSNSLGGGHVTEVPEGLDLAGAQDLINHFAEGSEVLKVRMDAWDGIRTLENESNLLTFLATGLLSTLERESATAATGILSCTLPQEVAPLNSGFFGGQDLNLERMRLGASNRWPGRFPHEYGFEAEDAVWFGVDWQRYTAYWIKRACATGDQRIVLATLQMLAQVRVGLGMTSNDRIVRQLSEASHFRSSDSNRWDTSGDGSKKNEAYGFKRARQLSGSTLVHGTFAWKGSWWHPSGTFHDYIMQNHRSDLYKDGKEFSWSGYYSEKHRDLAGHRFKRWVDSEGGLRTAIGHSYGGEVIARAVNQGATINEVVLLSAPIHHHHESMLYNVSKVFDVRLKFDIVLFAACARQRIPHVPNAMATIREFRLSTWMWNHGATRDPAVWKQNNIARKISL
ncbi:hypothetical protein [Glutamicibacter arilaitensis]|uniref:hypothetical protein n=1 Tax=Glutamicibacter arilaitensis TaxID=256701 RepID=UPI003FD4AC75